MTRPRPSVEVVPLDITAQLLRFWDRSGNPIVVVPFALLYHDPAFQPTSLANGQLLRARMRLRQVGPDAWVRDTLWRQPANRQPQQRGDLFSDGFIALPLGPSTTAWSLTATTAAYGGLDKGDCTPVEPLPLGGIVVSDLALGVPNSSTQWTVGDQQILLGAVNEFDRKDAVHLNYQIRSESAHDAAQTSITVTDITNPKSGKRVILMNFGERLAAGINFADHTLDMSKLHRGRFLLELQVGNPQGGGASVRSAEFVLK